MQSKFNKKLALLSVAVSSCMALSACSNENSTRGAGKPITPTPPVVNTVTKPTHVNIMEITSMTKDDITVNWLPAQDDNTPSSQIHYELHSSEKSDFTPTTQTKIYEVTGKHSATIENKLTGGKTYYLRLVAIDKDGSSTISEPMSVKIADIDPVINPVLTPTPTPTPNPTPPDPTKPNVNETKAIVEIPVDKTVQVTDTQVTLPKLTEVPKNGGFIVSADTEQPYLRKVVSSSVDKTTGETIVKTEQASLDEVMQQVTLSSVFKMSPLPTEGVEQGLQTGLIQIKKDNATGLSWQSSNYSYTAGNATQPTDITTAPNTNFLQVGLAKAEEDVLLQSEKSKAEGKSPSMFEFYSDVTTTFDPIIEFDKKLTWWKWSDLYVKLVTKASPNINQTITIQTRDAKSKIDEQYDLIKPRKFRKTYVLASGVPIVISGEMTLKMRVTGKATGKLKVTETLNLGYNNMEYGFEYKDGRYQEIKKATPNHYFTLHGEGGATADIEVALVPSLKVTAYETTTSRLVAEPYVKAGAGIEGHVDFVAGKDPNGYIGQGFDADYRLTEGYISGGLNAYMAANLSVFKKSLVTWPKKANLDDVTKYNQKEGEGGYRKYEVIANTKILGIPYLQQPKVDFNTIKADDSRAIMVRGVAKNIVFPFTNKSLIEWVQWTKPRVLNTRSTSQDAVINYEPRDRSKNWFVPKQAGTYIVRLGGHSSLGSWARQYKDVKVEITDSNKNGILDYWEKRYNLVGQDVNSDADGDGLTLLDEFNQGKNPTKPDNEAQAYLPNIVITPTQPIKGKKFSISLQGGSPDKIGRIDWAYDTQKQTTTAPNVYQKFDVTSDKNSLDVVLNFFDTTGKAIGTRRQTINLTAKNTGKQNILPVTGITYCTDAENIIACNLLAQDWLGLGQDGEIQAGQPMSYQLVSNGGDSCIKDNATGLIWESKTDDGGIHDKDNSYHWYNTNSLTNGGWVGFDYVNDTNCKGSRCNTEDFIAKLNASNYCGYSDWRLPTYSELSGIIDHGANGSPTINHIFTGTQSGLYWSSSSYAGDVNYAWGVSFYDGGLGYSFKGNGSYVRAVRSAP